MDSNTRTVCDAKTRRPEFLLVLHYSITVMVSPKTAPADRNPGAVELGCYFISGRRAGTIPVGRGSAGRLTCEPKIINRRHREPQLCDDLPETKNEQQRGERTDAE
jgi:hypothetical protein